MGMFCICLKHRGRRICLVRMRGKKVSWTEQLATRIVHNEDGQDCRGSTFSVPGELGVGHIKFERLTRNQNSHRRQCKYINLYNVIKGKNTMPNKQEP